MAEAEAESEREVDVLVKRVVKDIANAFKRNPNIDEIGVISCPEARCNRSPIVLVQNKLGVESWCVKFLLPYVQGKLLLHRRRRHWLDREALVDITSTALLLNPDFTTAWNIRKELLQCGVVNPEEELYLGKLALTRFPKSPETWIHRRWVLQQILRQLGRSRKLQLQHNDGEQADEGRSQQLRDRLARTLHQEMKVCCDAAGRYPSNYNAWSHRIWVLQHMGSSKVFHDELSSMRLWVSLHVSDHSGFHYRQFLLKELISELSQTPASPPSPRRSSVSRPQPGGEDGQLGPPTALQLVLLEMELCSDLIQSFPGHETLWSHRRRVFYLWCQWRRRHQQHCSSNGGGEEAAAQRGGLNGHAGDAMDVDGASLPDARDSKRLKRGVLLPEPPDRSSEDSFVSRTLDTCRDPEQRRFALAYKKWLDTVLGQQP
ncbi:protein prenyltransferase alpha subunit repeat-containing protein 1 [Brachionichthys hirsutus]|uniref:protein prenyltransferase alpha subunit repeat-containing protein 1 n=1 Tax=Brachionichthys hirsutus TaxID=412623 RepID=UPI0036046381